MTIINGGFSLDNLPSYIFVEEQIKVFQQNTASPIFIVVEDTEAGETPSAVRHEKSPQLPEDPGWLAGFPSGGILPSSSSSCPTTSHQCQICQQKVCNFCSIDPKNNLELDNPPCSKQPLQ